MIHSRKLWKMLLEVPTEQQSKILPLLLLCQPCQERWELCRRSSSASPSCAPELGRAAARDCSWGCSVIPGHLTANNNVWAPEQLCPAVTADHGMSCASSDRAVAQGTDTALPGTVTQLPASPAPHWARGCSSPLMAPGALHA